VTPRPQRTGGRSMRAAMSSWAAELHQRRRRRGQAAGAGLGRRRRGRRRRQPGRRAAGPAAPGGRRAGLRQQRDNVRLLAPADGVVTSRDAEPGSTVVAGQAVLRLIEPGVAVGQGAAGPGRSAGLAPGCRLRSCCARTRAAPCRQGGPGRGLSDSVTEERVALVSLRHAARRPVGGRTGRGDADAAGHRAGRAAAQRRLQRQAGAGRRLADRRRQPALRAGAHRRRRAWTARCRCSTA
jgi:hypothetical protein